MAKYMIKASYSPEGIKGVMAKGGTARVDERDSSSPAATPTPIAAPTTSRNATIRVIQRMLRDEARCLGYRSADSEPGNHRITL